MTADLACDGDRSHDELGVAKPVRAEEIAGPRHPLAFEDETYATIGGRESLSCVGLSGHERHRAPVLLQHAHRLGQLLAARDEQVSADAFDQLQIPAGDRDHQAGLLRALDQLAHASSSSATPNRAISSPS